MGQGVEPGLYGKDLVVRAQVVLVRAGKKELDTLYE
jgi:hypothetical protein